MAYTLTSQALASYLQALDDAKTTLAPLVEGGISGVNVSTIVLAVRSMENAGQNVLEALDTDAAYP